MNLGIETYIPQNQKPMVIVSNEQLFSDLIDFNDYCDRCSAMTRLSADLVNTLDNIRDIIRTVKKHPSAEALAVVESIFPDLKGNVSYETLKEKGKKILGTIVEGFRRVMKALKGLWDRMLNMIPTVRNRLSALHDRIKELPTRQAMAIGKWSYHGIDIMKEAGGWKIVINCTDEIINNAKSYTSESYRQYVSKKFATGDVSVSGWYETTTILYSAVNFIDKTKLALDKDKSEVKKCEADFKRAQNGAGDVDDMKAALHLVNLSLILNQIAYRTIIGTATSILANCKMPQKSTAK